MVSLVKIQQTDFISVLLQAYATSLALRNMTFKWKVKKKTKPTEIIEDLTASKKLLNCK